MFNTSSVSYSLNTVHFYKYWHGNMQIIFEKYLDNN
jgi:hypothetical protein